MELSDIPQKIIDGILDFTDERPQFTSVAVRTDGIGGWHLQYCKSVHGAEQITGGQNNTLVINVTEES